MLAGIELGALFNYYENQNDKTMIVEIYPKNSIIISNTPMGIEYSPDRSICEPDRIVFSISKDGYYNIELDINGSCPEITCTQIMPGDNIRTFLNTCEDGLYEKLISRSNEADSYCIGPYELWLDKNPKSTEGTLSIKKHDERSMLPTDIFFNNEIVTMIHRTYRGTMSSFEDEPLVW